jgi:hypothetical protein
MLFYFFDNEHSITQKLFFFNCIFSHLKFLAVFLSFITIWFFWLKVEYKLHHLFLIIKPATSIHASIFIVTFFHFNTALSFQINGTFFRSTIKSVKW